MPNLKIPCGALLAVALAACAQPPAAPSSSPAPSPAPAPGGTCQADAARFAVGQAYTEALAQEARARASATRVRAIRPGQAVTLEFDGGRLNLQLDAAGRVTAARCG